MGLEETGRIVWASAKFDALLIESKANLPAFEKCISLDDGIFRRHVETELLDGTVPVVCATCGHDESRGSLRGTLSLYRPPGSQTFQEVYFAKFDRPFTTGDCGSWVVNAATGKLIGHVTAGSLKSGLTMIMPASAVFEEAFTVLSTYPLGVDERVVYRTIPLPNERYENTWISPMSILGLAHPLDVGTKSPSMTTEDISMLKYLLGRYGYNRLNVVSQSISKP